MDRDFPLREYIRTNGISRAVEGGKFVIRRDIDPESRGIIAFGLFKCLYDYCTENEINDIFTSTQPKIVQKYNMPGFRQIGEPFEYLKPFSGVLWVPMHCDIREAYGNYLKNSAGDTSTK